MKEKVSILIPVYNRENLIEETVKSALNQTYKNIEIIVVDNKSTDNTWSVLQRLATQDERVKIFQNEKNIGPVKNWKRCVEEASGKYAKILWSDDLIAFDFIEKTLPFLEDNTVGFVYTKTKLFEVEKFENIVYSIGKTGVYDSEQYLQGVLFKGNYPVSPGCALFRLSDLKKNLLLEIPNSVGSDFSMHAIGNDLLIFLLTAHQYKKFGYIDQELSFFRVHKGSITIGSNEGKIPLHYALASSYFVEEYRKDLIQKQNTHNWVLLKRYRNSVKQYNVSSLRDFYVSNKDFSLDYPFILKKLIRKILYKFK